MSKKINAVTAELSHVLFPLVPFGIRERWRLSVIHRFIPWPLAEFYLPNYGWVPADFVAQLALYPYDLTAEQRRHLSGIFR